MRPSWPVVTQNLRKRLECKAEILRQREEQLAAAKKIYRELEDRNKELMVSRW